MTIVKYLFIVFFSTYLSIGFVYGQYLDPSKAMSQYILNAWDTDNGLPSNNLNDITQTQDGYLWIASFSGLSHLNITCFPA